MNRIRIALISDLHNEFFRDDGKQKPVPDLYLNGDSDIDVIVLAGDIDNAKGYGAEWAVWTSELHKIPVIYIMGNHEYYGSSKYISPVEKVKEITVGTNVHVLDSETVIIKGVKFIGTSLWTNFELFGSDEELVKNVKRACVEGMNDFDSIRLSSSRKFSKAMPSDLIRWFEHDVNYIESELQTPFDGKKVVVTHHAPSKECLPGEFQDDYLAAMYASNLDDLILKYKPEAWLYGHIHEQKTQRIGETLVMNYPRGYPHLQESPTLGYKLMIVVL